MGISSYPNGFKNGINIQGLNILNQYSGKVFWVDSGRGSDGQVGTFKQPLATLDAAIGLTSANNGDIILLAPGHAETLSAAGDVTIDVAGVTVIGLGTGTARPTFTLGTAATVEVVVSAANVTLQNLVFVASFADVANVFELTATDFTVDGCEFKASAANLNFLELVNTDTTDNSADNLKIVGCKWVEADTATLSAVDVNGDLDGLVFEGNYANLGVNTGDLPIVAGVATGKDLTNVQISSNTLVRLNDANALLIDPDTTTANTGVIAGNKVRHADIAAEILAPTGSPIGFFENYTTAVDDASGYLIPAADS